MKIIYRKDRSLFEKFYSNFVLFNIDLVNAKTGKILSTSDKIINNSANIFASLVVYLIMLAIVFCLFYFKVDNSKSIIWF